MGAGGWEEEERENEPVHGLFTAILFSHSQLVLRKKKSL